MPQAAQQAVEPTTLRTVDFSGVDAMTIANRLREGRASVGMTRKQVADATGVPLKTLEKYENGQMEPGVSRLKALARFLGLDILELIDEAQEHGGALPLRNPAPAATTKIADTRALLKQLAAEHGLELVSTEHLKHSSPIAPTVASLVDTNGIGVDLSPFQQFVELQKVATAYGANSAQTKRALVLAKTEFDDLDGLDLIDLADEIGLREVPEDDEDMEDDGTDESPFSFTRASLISRILVKAVFNFEPDDLKDEALARLHDELIDLFEIDQDTAEDPDSFGRSYEHVRDCQQRIVAKLMLEALLKRQAPDISKRSAYPKRKNEDEE